MGRHLLEHLPIGLHRAVIVLGVVQADAEGKEGLGGLAGGSAGGKGRLRPGLQPERAAHEGDEDRRQKDMV